jgi:hypothetical protein
MFSTFARILDLGRRHARSSHIQRARNAGHVVHGGRPRLVCRWRPDPTSGKPLGSWEIDGGGPASSAKPLSGWPPDQVCPRGLLPSARPGHRGAGRRQPELKGGHAGSWNLREEGAADRPCKVRARGECQWAHPEFPATAVP